MSAALDPFDPPGVEWRRVSPRLTTVRLLRLAVWAVPVLIIGGVAVLIWHNPWVIAVAGVVTALIVWAAVLIPRRVKALGWAVRDRDLFLRRGIMFRNLAVVPYVRIQMVDIGIGPIERSFGLASVTVTTASPMLTAALNGITPETAAYLRDILTDRGNLTGHPADSPPAQP